MFSFIICFSDSYNDFFIQIKTKFVSFFFIKFKYKIEIYIYISK
jgi:hypothetical protein